MAQTPAPPDDKAAARRLLAVALAWQAERDRAPKVTAKGEGSVAEQILTIAFERGVKVRTDPDLAEVLHAVELDSEVPLEALAAVAEILSYLYRTGHGPGAETQP